MFKDHFLGEDFYFHVILGMFFSSCGVIFVSISFWADVCLHFFWGMGILFNGWGALFGKLWKGRCLEDHPSYKVVSNPPVKGQNKAIWKGTNRTEKGTKTKHG